MKLKLLAATAAMALAVPANATLLVNGNFDDGLNGWTVSSLGGPGGFVAINFQIFNTAPPSAQFRSGRDSFRTLSQTIATTIGGRYVLTYSVRNQASLFNQFNVTTGGVTSSTSFDSPFAFTTFTQSFVASSEESLVQFAVNHGGVGGNFLFVDDVSLINIVPEPESWAMLIAGFGLVGAAARRRRSGRVLVA